MGPCVENKTEQLENINKKNGREGEMQEGGWMHSQLTKNNSDDNILAISAQGTWPGHHQETPWMLTSLDVHCFNL